MKAPSWVLSVALGFGLLLLWLGERVVDAGTARAVASGLGAVVILGAVALRGLRMAKAVRPDVAQVEQALLWLAVTLVGSLLVYGMTSDLFARLAGTTLETASPKLGGVLFVLWPAMAACALLPTLFIELSYAAMARAPVLETERIREARFAGLGLAFALTFAFSFQYVMNERDLKVDLSYFRMARPGDATKKHVAALDAKLEVYAFFPPGNDVGELVDAYLAELKAESPLLDAKRHDYALEPTKSKDLGVSANGVVVLKKGDRKESLFIGVEMEKARVALRALDADFQRRLLQVAKARRTVYMTQGHGERLKDGLGGGDARSSVSKLYAELQGQNFDVRTLSAADGLGVEVPKDAAAVFVIGPTDPFTPPEADTLERYAKQGGRLFVALDPENERSFDELLRPLGLAFTPQRLADEKFYVRTNSAQGPADRYNVATKSFSSHPTVTYLSKMNGVFITLGVGALDELPQHANDLTIDFPARSAASTFNDVNKNFEPDMPPEVKRSYGLIAAVSRRAASNKAEEELRAIVVGDSDFMADLILDQAQGNALFLLDGLKWLLGEDQLTGSVNTELDVPLTRTRSQDAWWFYATTFLAPLAVVGVGFFLRRRTSRPRVTPAGKAS